MRLFLQLMACSGGDDSATDSPTTEPTDNPAGHTGSTSSSPTTDGSPPSDTGNTPGTTPTGGDTGTSTGTATGTGTTPGTATGDTAAPPPPPPDYRSAGPHRAARSQVTSRATSCRGGTVADRFDPDGIPSSAVVVLGHGFSGNRSQMVGWGEHWATWGLTVLVPDLCNSLPWNVDHVQNGRDMVALAQDEAPGVPALYVGYSAGGLAALVAAAEDTGAAGHLGLDAVDAFNIARQFVNNLPPNAAGLYAEPSSCNSGNNMVPVYNNANVQTVKVVDSDHCDWMWPAQAGCGITCATGPNLASIDRSIRSLSTSWLLWKSGIDPAAAAWWTPGQPEWDGLVNDGWILP